MFAQNKLRCLWKCHQEITTVGNGLQKPDAMVREPQLAICFSSSSDFYQFNAWNGNVNQPQMHTDQTGDKDCNVDINDDFN